MLARCYFGNNFFWEQTIWVIRLISVSWRSIIQNGDFSCYILSDRYWFKSIECWSYHRSWLQIWIFRSEKNPFCSRAFGFKIEGIIFMPWPYSFYIAIFLDWLIHTYVIMGYFFWKQILLKQGMIGFLLWINKLQLVSYSKV